MFSVFEGTGIDPTKEGTRLSFASGEEISLPAGLILVESGAVRVTRRGTALLLNTVCPGGMLGASTLCSPSRADTVLTASGETAVLFLPEETVLRLLSENRAFLERYLSFVSRRICFLNDKVGTFASPTAEDKLLLHLMQNGGKLEVKNRRELASSLSMGRATLYRAMDSLTASGRLRPDGDTLVLL